MGRLEILVDPAGLAGNVAVELQHPAQVQSILPRLFEHLGTDSAQVLRVRVRPGLESAVQSLVGMVGVSLSHVSARDEMRDRLCRLLPPWLNDDVILRLDLLAKGEALPVVPVGLDDEDVVLFLCCPDVVRASSGEAFLDALLSQSNLSTLCEIGPLKERLLLILARTHSKAVAEVFDSFVFSSRDPESSLRTLLRGALLEPYRELAATHGLGVSFPPRPCAALLLMELASSCGYATAVRDEQDLVNVLHAALTKIESQQLPVDVLTAYVKHPVPSVLSRLQEAILARPRLATAELRDALMRFESPHAGSLAKVVANLMEAREPQSLSEIATIKDVLDWASQYLNYAANKWRRGEEPSSDLSQSFARWVIANPARRNNGMADWRKVSSTVRNCLENNNTVALIVVDALSALVSPELVSRIEGALPKVAIRHDTIFAPIPTLTETSKLAVATGRASVSGANVEVALRAAYAPTINAADVQVEKSWGESAEPVLREETRLLVYFENHIDDLLHECSDLTTFRRQLSIILEKIEKLITALFSQAAQHGRRLVVVVSADHGFALFQSEPSSIRFGNADLDWGERCIRGISPSYPVESFARVQADGLVGSVEYLVPLDRTRLRKGAAEISHGGLTPEEVLIPLITIADAEAALGEALSISCPTSSVSRVSGGWEVKLILKANTDTLRRVELRFPDPFSGHQSIGELLAGLNHEVVTVLRSPVEQSGLTTVAVIATYLTPFDRVGETEARLKLSLPPLLLKGTEQTTAFNKMFD